MFSYIPAFVSRSIQLFAITATIIYTVSCSSKKAAENKAPEKFQVTNPAVLDTVYVKEYVAEIQSVQNVEIRSKVRGIVERVHVDEGNFVKAGQILFILSSREYRESLVKAKAQLKSALSELKSIEVETKNTRLLTEKNIVSKTELEMLQAKKEAALAKIDEAKSDISVANINIGFTQIKAPFSGTINRIPNKAGSLVEEGTLLTTISNNKEVFAYFNVSEKEYLDFVKQKQLGKPQPVSLQLANGELFSHTGTVETIENEFDKNTGTLAFRARFANPDQILKHGATAKVLMDVQLKNVLLIPQKSTFEVQENVYVYVVDEKNVVQARKVTPVIQLSNAYVISSGLTLNDRFIYEGIQRVKEGDKIIPEKTSFTQPKNL